MKEILLIVTLSVSLSANAQYVYFNNLYEIDMNSNSLNYKILQTDSAKYLSIGKTTDVFENQFYVGSLLREINNEGDQLSRINIPLPIIFPAGAGILNESVLQLDDGSFTQFHVTSNNMEGYAPLLTRVNSSLENLWTQTLLIGATPPNNEGHSNEIVGCGLTNVSDTSFMLLTFNRWGWSANPDSLRLRYLTFDYDGNVLANHVQPVEEGLSNQGIKLISGDRLITWGTFYEEGDLQVFIRKLDLEGNVIDSLEFGNFNAQNVCDDVVGDIVIVDDSLLYMHYGYCIEDGGFQNMQMKDHLLIVNLNAMTTIDEIPFTFSGDEEPVEALAGMAIVESPRSEITSVVGIIDGSNNGHMYIICTDTLGNEIWRNSYATGYSYYAESLLDINNADDGGYIATGTTYVIFDDFSLMQKNWILKIDACGYEQPSGCPAVVSTDEETKISSDIQLWPNPCHNILKAVLPNDAVGMRLYDQTGRVVFQENVYYPNQQWNVSALERGVYVMEVVMEDGSVEMVKMVKQ
jgi:Secretion system C-terminal sorting domain